jgi:hypothetical protein
VAHQKKMKTEEYREIGRKLIISEERRKSMKERNVKMAGESIWKHQRHEIRKCLHKRSWRSWRTWRGNGASYEILAK